MSPPKPIQIIGGGLAGLTLGIALRRREIPVTIFEAGNYPRHRVCGEFISGRGLWVLDSLGLKEKFFNAGAIRAETAMFVAGRFHSPVHQLPVPAICLSRFVMDNLLANEFQKLGGDLQSGARRQNECGEGTVRANGRRVQPVEHGWRWFGLKTHARNVSLATDLEMHLSKNGYVGLCRLANGDVNVCGLFRRNGFETPLQPGFDLLRGEPTTVLRERLAHAEFDKASLCSVAGLSLKPQLAAEKNEVCIGDALTMIPPVTGNGMSLAFESAQLAIEPVFTFSRGTISWNEARQKIALACDEKFSRRLRWANWLQRLMFSPLVQMRFGKILFQSETFWKMMFNKTR
jgi:flavin-dependent dehydrogenase